jgi:hypothetical protein
VRGNLRECTRRISCVARVTLGELATLADGALPPRRRAEVQAVAASPRLARLLGAQVRASRAIRTAAASVEAPDDLRAAIAALCRAKGISNSCLTKRRAEAESTANPSRVALVLFPYALPVGADAPGALCDAGQRAERIRGGNFSASRGMSRGERASASRSALAASGPCTAGPWPTRRWRGANRRTARGGTSRIIGCTPTCPEPSANAGAVPTASGTTSTPSAGHHSAVSLHAASG